MIIHECVKQSKSLLIYLIVIFLIFALYTWLSIYWVTIGDINPQLLNFEAPFILALSLIFYFPKIEKKIVKYIIPAVPILILYIYNDIYYSFLARAPRPSDIQNFKTIFDFSIGMALGLISLSLLIPLSVVILLYHAYKKYSLKSFALSLLWKVLLICLIIVTLSTNRFIHYFTGYYKYVHWSEQVTIQKNGRFTSFIYYGNQEKQNFLKLKKYISTAGTKVQNNLYPDSVKKYKNIYIVVLESFIDPRLLDDVRFSKTPLSARLKSYLYKQTSFSHVISPVYGGRTAQAEFELLTGIKAFAEINSIEFNVMNGNSIESFVNKLKKFGYNTLATVANNKGFFNSLLAYKSIGFNKVYFLEEEADFVKRKGDNIIFDGDLFDYNIRVVKRILRQNKKPIFNYILGMYGHYPYDRNLEERPNIIEVDHEDSRVLRVANQFFYRTKAIANYINNLISIDPNSIIYITSDHLPPIIDDKVQYKFDRFVNISLLLEDGKPVNVDNKKYFEIPWLIWDLISEKEHKRYLEDTEMEKLYFKILAESI